METLVMKYHNILGKRVLLTGHDGFKGTWLSAILEKLECEVLGVSNFASENRAFYLSNGLKISEEKLCLTQSNRLKKLVTNFKPEIVIHMAAQPLVRKSYDDPIDTWQTNLIGTLNILEACRSEKIVPKLMIVTTDKVYRNKDWQWGYRENDQLGGKDPYSASKSACEILVRSHRESYSSMAGTIVVRGGNVIGGGDLSADRLMPDLYRDYIAGRVTYIRNPGATRPWQYVLDCLDGYMSILNRHLEDTADLSFEYNIGPNLEANKSVLQFSEAVQQHHNVQFEIGQTDKGYKESNFLYLDSSRAYRECKWKPQITFENAIQETCKWYFSSDKLKSEIFSANIKKFIENE